MHLQLVIYLNYLISILHFILSCYFIFIVLLRIHESIFHGGFMHFQLGDVCLLNKSRIFPLLQNGRRLFPYFRDVFFHCEASAELLPKYSDSVNSDECKENNLVSDLWKWIWLALCESIVKFHHLLLVFYPSSSLGITQEKKQNTISLEELLV